MGEREKREEGEGGRRERRGRKKREEREEREEGEGREDGEEREERERWKERKGGGRRGRGKSKEKEGRERKKRKRSLFGRSSRCVRPLATHLIAQDLFESVVDCSSGDMLLVSCQITVVVARRLQLGMKYWRCMACHWLYCGYV